MVRMKSYKRIRISRTETRDEQRIVMERFLGRRLSSDEVVHHVDGNRANNALSNLQVLSRKDHLNLHRPDYKAHEWTIQERHQYSARNSRENHPQSKLTEAGALGLSSALISKIRNGRRWC